MNWVGRRLRVAAFTGGRNVPSARFRVRQYRNDLQERGVDLKEYHPIVGSSFPPKGTAAASPGYQGRSSNGSFILLGGTPLM